MTSHRQRIRGTPVSGGANGISSEDALLSFVAGDGGNHDHNQGFDLAAVGQCADDLAERINSVEQALSGTMLFGSEIAAIRAALDEIYAAPVPSHDYSAINALSKRIAAIESVVVVTTGPDLVSVTSAGGINFVTPGGVQAKVTNLASAANYIDLQGGATGTGPSITANGSDANISLRLFPKGTGSIVASGPMSVSGALSAASISAASAKFGALTASADAPVNGYITIQDSGGTICKLATIA